MLIFDLQVFMYSVQSGDIMICYFICLAIFSTTYAGIIRTKKI